MGLRGPLPRKAEPITIDPPERPATPKWLNGAARKIFRALIDDLVAARVPIKRVDGHAIAMAAHCIQQTQEWAEIQAQPGQSGEFRRECAALVARFQRDGQEWLSVIGGTPKSRAQMGLRSAEQKKPSGALAVIQARRDRQQA
jgi:phage terminase small subunit